MKARLVATIDVGERSARRLAVLDGRILVVARDGLHEVAGDALVPVIAPLDVTDLSGPLVLTPDALVEIGGARRALPPLEGAEVHAVVALPDGAVVAMSRPRHTAGAAVMRLDRDGRVVWRNATPPPPTLMETTRRNVASGVESPGPPLEATEWTMYGPDLHVSGDRVLAVFSDMPRTGIGVGYGLDLATGALVYATTPGPHGRVFCGPLDGQFVVGLQGYGWFNSRLVDRGGETLATWKSHGIVFSRDPLRLLELENQVPSRSHIATLRRDGSVQRGAHLPDYYTSPVVVAPDGAAIFWRNGAVLRASPDGDRLERLFDTPADDNAWSAGFAGSAPGRVVLAWSGKVDRDGARVEGNRLFVIDLED